MTDYQPLLIINQNIFHKNNKLLCKFAQVYWTVVMVSGLFTGFWPIEEGFTMYLAEYFHLFNYTKTIWLSFKLHSNGEADKSTRTVLYTVEMYWIRFYNSGKAWNKPETGCFCWFITWVNKSGDLIALCIIGSSILVVLKIRFKQWPV